MEYLDCDGDLYDYINAQVFWKKSKVQNGYSFLNGNVYHEYLMGKERKMEITMKMIDAVNGLHKNVGIIHGDIKTCNIVLSKINTLKLIDFGASIFSEEGNSLIKTDWNHGTLGYSSPEDNQYYLLGKPSDIYSLGVSLIELWAGKIWRDSDDFSSCRNEVLKSLRMIEKNDTKVGSILRKMVTIDFKRRPTIEKILKEFNKVY
jgi:serine/threonine protein kinase